jgi:hypothetical protein
MRFPWQARKYERTCAGCGYAWRVPRQFARRPVRTVSMFQTRGLRVSGGLDPRATDHSEYDTEIQSSLELSKEAGAFRVCPKCGCEQYTQRAARR